MKKLTDALISLEKMSEHYLTINHCSCAREGTSCSECSSNASYAGGITQAIGHIRHICLIHAEDEQ